MPGDAGGRLAFAYWERATGNGHLFWFVVGFGIFAVVAMWVFPEALGGKPEPRNGSRTSSGQRAGAMRWHCRRSPN